MNLLKSDAERRKSVMEYQNNKKNKTSSSGFFDAKEKEFFNILKRIERMKTHKLEQAQQEAGPSAGQNESNRKQTTHIEKQIK